MLYQCFALVWSTITILISGPVLVEIHQQGDSLYNKNTIIHEVCSGCFVELQVTSKEPFYFQERSGHNLALTGSTIKIHAVCPTNLSDSNDHFTLPIKRDGSTQQLVSSQEAGVPTAVPLFLLLTSPEFEPTTAVSIYFSQDVIFGIVTDHPMVSTAVPLFLLFTSPEIGATTALSVYFSHDVILGIVTDPMMLQGGYNVQVFCPANTSQYVPMLTRWADPTHSGKQNSTLVLWIEEDCVSAISVLLPDESASDLCYSEEGICAHDNPGAATAIVVWDRDLTPMNTIVNDASDNSNFCNKETSAVPKRDPEMILVTKEVFYTYFAIVVFVIGALLVNNRITFSEGKKTEKNLKNKIAVYEAFGEQCVKVYQDMGVQARKEKSYLKCKKQRLRVTSAQKCTMMKTAQQCQLITYKTKLGRKALEAKKTEVKAHIARLRNEIGKAKKENAEIQEKHKCADTLKKHINMELEVKEGNQSQTKEAIKKMKEKSARLRVSKKANEKRITETNENVEDVEKKIVSVVWQIDEKELEILNVIKQTRIDVCEYNSRLCEAMSLMPDHSSLPYQPAAAVISSGSTAPDGFGCSHSPSSSSSSSQGSGWSSGIRKRLNRKNFLLA